jgi:hypothetical protein
MNDIKINIKEGKPKNRILGFLETKDDNQNMGWDCAPKKKNDSERNSNFLLNLM